MRVWRFFTDVWIQRERGRTQNAYGPGMSYNAIHLRHTAWRLCVRHGAAPAPITACIWSTAYSPWIWPRSGRWRAWIFAGKMCIRDRPFTKLAEDTLIPDIVSLVNINGDCQFIIFDAKYYNIQLEQNKKLCGQPGIESITKQYLYQLAFQPFVDAHQIGMVRNCFLLPTAGTEIVDKGVASLAMLNALGLQEDVYKRQA